MSVPSSGPERAPRPGIGFALRFLLAGLIVLVVAGVAVASSIEHEASKVVDEFQKHSKVDAATVGALDDVASGKPQTMLLVGDDHRYAEGGAGGQRSDTMILVRLDPDANATTMLSLPRDLLVTLPGSAGQVKLNSAYSKGPPGLIETLKRILSTPNEPFEINHFVSIRFTAFSKAVNTFGCFYADIDRKYFNDNNPPAGGGGPYAAIDVPSGYQRMCGEQALSYVRFRHLDSDLVREARQTHFLAEARAQIADSTLLDKRDELLKAISRYIKTDIQSEKGLLGVVKLAVNVVSKPTKRIVLEVSDTPSGDVVTTPTSLAKVAQQFLHPTLAKKKSSAAPKPKRTTTTKRRKKKASGSSVPATLMADSASPRAAIATSIAPKLRGLPIYFPKLMQNRARYQPTYSRAYDIQSPGGTTYPWQAYRLVVSLAGGESGPGQYYGVQGTTWKDPPILKLADDEESLGGRKFQVVYDGDQIRQLIWKTPQGTYWLSNSLNNGLSNTEMRALARSFTRYAG